MKTTVYFLNKQRTVPITNELKKNIRAAVRRTLKNEKFEKDAEVSVTFVDNEEIHRLNLEYRGKDKPTDVLSFPMEDGCESEGDIDPYNGAVLLGDIIISAEKAASQAEEYGHGIEREICFLAVHSTLHLLGYDHETSEEDEKYMNMTQENVLLSIGLPRE
ncbi:MAG: rRNA maturation RNase YbeY [Eubacteriales bacterium]